ncbi:MAG: nucleoside triphosphate pyrophosphohydrolase [Oscillospiraceae bacterium]|nr:nucleoside triphosphate pyrophosphohydrolase [Oscillospiraceae bacterium]
MIDFENKLRYGLSDLLNLMYLLRSPEGCPWDREQTHSSIRRNLLEEAYEAATAIDENNTSDLLEELGDILMQVVFHADIAKDDGTFTFDDIADVACKKLLRRHPHVFGNDKADTGGQSLLLWENIKREEKQFETTADTMKAVARSLPALWRAEKIQKKAAKAGFDWPDYTGAFETLSSELAEFEKAVASAQIRADGGDTSANAPQNEAIFEELGDILFSAVNVARFFNVDPEYALTAASDKFTARFGRVEEKAASLGRDLSDMTTDEIEELYRQVKLEK